MRKITLLIMAVFTFGFAFAQKSQCPKMNQPYEISETYTKPVPTTNLLKGLQATGDTIWYNDCSNPSDWLISDGPTSTGGAWEFGVAAGLLDTYTSYGGTNPFNPPTQANGGAFINGIQYLINGGMVMMDSYLTVAQPINLGAYNAVILAFHERYKAFNYDKAYVEVSSDNVNWTQYLLHDELAVNTYAPDDYTEINISAIAGNEMTVWIRFHLLSTSTDPQYGAAYGWRIDDVLLKESAAYNMDVTNGWANYIDGSIGYCSMIPRSQNTSYVFSSKMSNQGSLSLTNVSYNVVVDNGFYPVYDETKDSIGTWVTLAVDSMAMDVTFDPANISANYHALMTVTADEIDEDMSNNTFEINFSVTDSVYAHDDGSASTVTGPSRFTDGIDGDLVGCQYYIPYDDTVSSISVFIDHRSTVGTIIVGQVYRYDAGLSERVLVIDSDEHMITQEDLGSWVNLPLTFDDPIEVLISGSTWYDAAVSCYWGSDTVWIGDDMSNSGIHDFQNEASLRLGGTWYWITAVPMIRLNMFRAPVEICNPFMAENSISDVTCFSANDGAVNLTVGGGDGNYSFLWSNGDTTAVLSGVSSGTYTVTVTTCGGFNPTDSVMSFVVDGPATEFVVNENITATTCGSTDGEIALNATGGAAPYTFSWSNGFSTATITGLGVGEYGYTVSDDLGCVISNSVELTVPDPPTVAGQVTNESDALNDGSIEVFVSGGAAPFTYFWSDSSTTSVISGLSGGWYDVTITDNNMCEAYNSFFVIPFDSTCTLTATATGVDITCNGSSDGSASVVPANGTGLFIYLWNNVSGGDTITGLNAGTYIVLVEDSAHCFASGTVVISEPDAIEATFVTTTATCATSSDGAIDMTSIGGTNPYTFAWGGLTETTEDLSGIAVGSYSVTITDDHNCTYTSTVSVQAGTSPMTITLDDARGPNPEVDSYINITVASGVEPYTYLWSNGATTSDLTAVPVGAFSVTITDALGCIVNGGPWDLVGIGEIMEQNVSIFPNPTSGKLNVVNAMNSTITVYNILGEEIVRIENASSTETIDFSGVADGTYTVKITLENSVVTRKISVTK